MPGGQGFHCRRLALGLGGGGRETRSVLGEEGLVRVVRLNSTTTCVVLTRQDMPSRAGMAVGLGPVHTV